MSNFQGHEVSLVCFVVLQIFAPGNVSINIDNARLVLYTKYLVYKLQYCGKLVA
jgi:hypothetical protein